MLKSNIWTFMMTAMEFYLHIQNTFLDFIALFAHWNLRQWFNMTSSEAVKDKSMGFSNIKVNQDL